MNVKDIDQLLQQQPFFTSMDDALRGVVVGCTANQQFDAGGLIFRENDPADTFYLLRRGSVALEIHLPGREPLVIDTLHEGDILGWSWLLPPYRWTLDARAVEPTRTVSLDAACLRAKMAADHELGFQLYQRFMPVIARRLQAGRLQLVDMYATPGGAS